MSYLKISPFCCYCQKCPEVRIQPYFQQTSPKQTNIGTLSSGLLSVCYIHKYMLLRVKFAKFLHKNLIQIQSYALWCSTLVFNSAKKKIANCQCHRGEDLQRMILFICTLTCASSFAANWVSSPDTRLSERFCQELVSMATNRIWPNTRIPN